jgi:hypothetical protein
MGRLRVIESRSASLQPPQLRQSQRILKRLFTKEYRLTFQETTGIRATANQFDYHIFRGKSFSRGHIVTDGGPNQLARAWITLQTTPQYAPEYNSLFWSFEQTYSLVREDPIEAWKLILTIWSVDQSLPTRQSLSAGLLEELLCYHGERIIPHIEQQAKEDPSFAMLLVGVSRSAMNHEVWNRLQAAWINNASMPQPEKLPTAEVIESALLEFAKLAALLLCMLSLYIVFRTLFLSIEDPHAILQPPQIFTNRILDALLLVGASAGVSFLGAIIFRAAEPHPHPSLTATLPLQIFSWATSIMVILFFLARFLETHYIFTPKVHW